MSFTEDLLDGIARAAADNPRAEWKLTYQKDRPYLPTETGILFKGRGPDDSASVVITSYVVDDDPALSESVIGIQFMVTGDQTPGSIHKIVDDLFSLFHGMHSVTLGTCKVITAVRRSGANLGQDGSGRVTVTENYYFTVHRPSNNRT